MNKILLPGLSEQIKFLLEHFAPNGKNILIVGGNTEAVAEEFLKANSNSVEIIVEDYEQFLQTRINLKEKEKIEVKIMDFTATDFKRDTFDLIYAQASVSVWGRNKIIKELKRILKPSGIFCNGEILKLQKDVPKFIEEMFERSGLEPLFVDEIQDYYRRREFEILAEKDFSYTLKEFYSEVIRKSKDAEKTLSKEEKSFYKKLLNKIHHETNVFLRMGGDKYVGFKTLILQSKKESK